MKKIKISKTIWRNLGLFFAIGTTFAALLTAAVLVNHNIDGQVTFPTVSQTYLPDGVNEFILNSPNSKPRNQFSGYVHAQSQPTLDGAFNEQMVNGIADFIAPNTPPSDVPVFISPNSQANNFLGQYQAMLSAGFRVTTLGGFDHVPAISNALSESRFDQYGFILVDEILIDNQVASAIFQGEQSGFLAGVATGLYLKNHFETYQSNGLKAATYGGRPFNPVVAFMGGYQQGIDYYNQHLAQEAKFMVELIDLGDFDSFFVGGFESDRAIAITERMLNLDADAIFPIAGVQTREVVRVVNQRNEPAVVIGVDTPMENNSTFQEINNQTKLPTIPFSAIKDFRTMTTRILDNVYNGRTGINSNPDNGVAGLGWINVGNIDNELVSVSQGGIELFNMLTTSEVDAIYKAARLTKNVFNF